MAGRKRNKMGIELNDQQVFALFELEDWWYKSNNQVFEISGAAGTGKTTLVRYLIDRLGLSFDEVLFVAYMGKAASQLARNGLPAKTVHSAIYRYEKVVARDENNKMIFKPNGSPLMVGKFFLKERIGKKIKLIVLDEAPTLNEEISKDLLSFGIPVIALGDLNQLPPVFGKSYFLQNPNVILTQIMRQAEGNPIVWLSQQVLNDIPLKTGVYGRSAVINRNDLTDYHFKHADVVLTGTNALRTNVNNLFREKYKGIKNLSYPYVGEKVVCRKNNWNREIDKGIFLTNGTAGTIEYVDRSSYNGKSILIDFHPEFAKSDFKNLKVNYNMLMGLESESEKNKYDFGMDYFEFAYAITVHLSQGSQYPNVLFLNERFLNDTDYKRFLYTAITRAIESITIVF